MKEDFNLNQEWNRIAYKKKKKKNEIESKIGGYKSWFEIIVLPSTHIT